MPAILHINDSNLLIQHGEQLWRSQGYAWLKDGQVYFDIEPENNAVNNCRLEPQQINSRYWQQCEQTAIPSNSSGMRHAADLVWRHFSELKEEYQLTEVVLVVPSHYQAKNLQLLLGIAKSCGLQVVGLVNKAVYALHQQLNSNGRYLHIDVQLHQTVCSEVMVEDGLAKLGSIELLHQVGLQAMQDALLKTIQDRFISSDRFDPLHYAETEQQLFNELPALAERVNQQGKGNIQVRYQGQQHLTSIDSKQWHRSIASFIDQLQSVEVDGKPAHRYYDFNGFVAADLNTKHSSLLGKPPLTSSVISTLGADSSGQMIYRTEIGVDIVDVEPESVNTEPETSSEVAPLPATVPVKEPQSSDRQTATHILQAGVAVPIDNAEISWQENQLGVAASADPNLQALFEQNKLFVLGDETRTSLRAGDRLGSNLADGVLTLIHVAALHVTEL